MSIREIPYFYGQSRKNDRLIRKMAGFTDDLKKPVLIATPVVQMWCKN